jgi:Grx4 family monothiol glutaredoxin
MAISCAACIVKLPASAARSSPAMTSADGGLLVALAEMAHGGTSADRQLGVKFHGINILVDPELREGIKNFSQWPTIPQLYVKGEFIGGCDIVREMFETGELEQVFKEKGVALAEAA